jgi:hypothetical protein
MLSASSSSRIIASWIFGDTNGPQKDPQDGLLSPLSLEKKRQSQFLKKKLEEMDVDLDNVEREKELQQRLIQRTVEEMEETEEEEEGQDEGTMANNTHQKEEMLSPLSTEKKRQSELMKEMLIETNVDPDEMERNRELQQRLIKEQQPKDKQEAKLKELVLDMDPEMIEREKKEVSKDELNTEDYPEQHLLALVTKTSGSRKQITRSELGLSILGKAGIEPVVIDGYDPSKKVRRNDLFEISDIRGNYPQFFFVDGEKTSFLGGLDKMQSMKESGTLDVLAGPSVGDEEALASDKEYEVSSESTPHAEKQSDLEPDELTEDPFETPKHSTDEPSSASSLSWKIASWMFGGTNCPQKDPEDDLLSPLSLEKKRQSQFLKKKLEEMNVDLDNVEREKELQQRLIQRTVEEMEEAEEEEKQDEGTTANNTHQKEEMLSPLSTEKKRHSELMKEMLIETDLVPDEIERNRELQQRLIKEQQPKENQRTKLRPNKGDDHDVEPKTTDVGDTTEATMIEPAVIEHKQVTTKPMKKVTPSPTSEKENKIVEESSTKVREIQANTPTNKEKDSKASAVAVHPSDRRPFSEVAVRDAKRARILANMHRLDKTMEQARRLILYNV